jgi:cytochrome P450
LSTATISLCQDKVHEEQHRIFGDSGRAATSCDLRKMQYLEMCIKEAMRMFPVAPIIARHLTGDVALCKYPAGLAVLHKL